MNVQEALVTQKVNQCKELERQLATYKLNRSYSEENLLNLQLESNFLKSY